MDALEQLILGRTRREQARPPQSYYDGDYDIFVDYYDHFTEQDGAVNITVFPTLPDDQYRKLLQKVVNVNLTVREAHVLYVHLHQLFMDLSRQ